MFVLCGECHQNYDDSFQLADCDGPGGRGHLLFGNHATYASSPIESHKANTRAVIVAHRLNGGRSAPQDGSPPVAPVLDDQSTDPPVTGRQIPNESIQEQM